MSSSDSFLTEASDLAWSILEHYLMLLQEFFAERLCAFVVFGSFARGEAAFPESDVDLLIVVADDEVGRHSVSGRVELLFALEKRLATSRPYARFKESTGFSPSLQEHLLTEEEFKAHPPLLLDLVTDARVLYDTGVFAREMEKLRERLEEHGAQKVYARDGSWFWILKPDLRLGEVVEL